MVGKIRKYIPFDPKQGLKSQKFEILKIYTSASKRKTLKISTSQTFQEISPNLIVIAVH